MKNAPQSEYIRMLEQTIRRLKKELDESYAMSLKILDEKGELIHEIKKYANIEYNLRVENLNIKTGRHPDLYKEV